MSLICAHCGKIVVMSDSPDHLGGCGSCNLNEADAKRIAISSEEFQKKVRKK